MNTTAATIKILGFTAEQYEDLYLLKYHTWCEAYSKEFEIPFQNLIANSGVSNYFLEHFQNLEHQALPILLAGHDNLTTSKLRELFDVALVDIFKNYPKVLFDAARKLEIVNNLN